MYSLLLLPAVLLPHLITYTQKVIDSTFSTDSIHLSEMSRYSDTRISSNYNSELFTKIGNIELEKKNFKGALDACEKAIKNDSRNVNAYILCGDSKMGLKDYKGAIREYNIAISISPSYAYPYQESARAKFLTDDFRGAISDYDKAIDLMPESAYLYTSRAESKRKILERKSALNDYKKAVEFAPEYDYAYSMICSINAELNDYNSALEACNNAIEINPLNLTYIVMRGFIQFELSQYKEAINDFNAFLAKANLSNQNNSLVNVYSYRARAKLLINDYKGAIEDYTSAIKINSTDSDLYLYRGEARYKYGDKNGASADFKMAAEIKDSECSNSSLNDKTNCLSLANVEDLKDLVGGPLAYQDIIKWASKNLKPREIYIYDQTMDSGNYTKIKSAILELKHKYDSKK